MEKAEERIVFKKRGRGGSYWVDKVKAPRVSNIIGQLDKPALMYWAVNCSIDYILSKATEPGGEGITIHNLESILVDAKKEWRNVGKKAMDIGTETHNIIERYLRSGSLGAVSVQCEASVSAFLDWERNHHLEVVALEKIVGTPNYAGRADIFGYLNGVLYCIDIKTSKRNEYDKQGIYQEYRYQVAAYRHAANHGVTAFADKKVEGVGILRLDKITGEPEWSDTTDTVDNDYKAFALLVDFFHLTNPKFRG